jgi:hypothetical protein
MYAPQVRCTTGGVHARDISSRLIRKGLAYQQETKYQPDYYGEIFAGQPAITYQPDYYGEIFAGQPTITYQPEYWRVNRRRHNNQTTVGKDWHINLRRYQPGYCGEGLAYQLGAVSARLLWGRIDINWRRYQPGYCGGGLTSIGGGIGQATVGED